MQMRFLIDPYLHYSKSLCVEEVSYLRRIKHKITLLKFLAHAYLIFVLLKNNTFIEKNLDLEKGLCESSSDLFS